ncbi:MAG TPA: glycosyltransferase family 2 protein [Terriglobia bacterium]|nr:glycosyltransferase family 2 protein [Terriglobia bacterium]
MPSLFVIFLLFAAALIAQSTWSLRDGYRFLAYLRRSRAASPVGFHPAAALIVPVRGIEPEMEGNVDALLAQDYPDYQLIFVVARESDPAYGWLNARCAGHREAIRGPNAVRVVLAGLAEERGEKVNNLLAALQVVPSRAEVFAFADSDARPGENWLRSLIDPLGDSAVTVSTGFRWYLPAAGSASRARAAWDASIAMLLGDRRAKFAWGGSMAVRASDFRRLKVAEHYWAHTVSDDYGLTRAVRDAGGWIRFEPKCLVAATGGVTWGGFLRWANRQIIITRVYSHHLWAWGLASHLLFCGTIVLGLGLAVSGSEGSARLLAAGSVLTVLLLGLAKARLRTSVARLAFPEEARRRDSACYWRWWPLIPWVMLLNFVTAGLTRRIEWRGTEYELISPAEIRILRRDA